jgi:hypothetical protein
MSSSACPLCGAPVSAADERRGECPHCRKPLAVSVTLTPRGECATQAAATTPPAHFYPPDDPIPPTAAGWGTLRAGLLVLSIWALLGFLLYLTVGVNTSFAVGGLEGRSARAAFEEAAVTGAGQLPLGLLALAGIGLCCAVPRAAAARRWAVSSLACFGSAAAALALAVAILAYADWGRSRLEWRLPFLIVVGTGMILLAGGWASLCLLLRRAAIYVGSRTLGAESLSYLIISLAASSTAAVSCAFAFIAYLRGVARAESVLTCWAGYFLFGAGSLFWLLTLLLRLRGRIRAAELEGRY